MVASKKWTFDVGVALHGMGLIETSKLYFRCNEDIKKVKQTQARLFSLLNTEWTRLDLLTLRSF